MILFVLVVQRFARYKSGERKSSMKSGLCSSKVSGEKLSRRLRASFPKERATALRPCGFGTDYKTPESRKSEKITKKIQNPPSWVGARKYEKITEMAQKSPFLYFFGIFFIFSGPNPGRGILHFFVIFSHFRDSGVL